MTRFFNAAGIIVFSVLLLFALLWGVLVRFQKSSLESNTDPFSLVPSDAWLILDMKDLSRVNQEIENYSLTFLKETSPGTIPLLPFHTTAVDSLGGIMDGSEEHLRNARMLISLHGSIPDNFHVLYNIRVQGASARMQQIIPLMLGNGSPGESFPFNNFTINSFITSDGKSWFYSVFKGSLLLSGQRRLIEQSVVQHNSGSGINVQPGFEQMRSAAGRRNDNLFFDGSRFCDVLPIGHEALFPCHALPGWMAWDFFILGEEIRLSGFGYPAAGRPSFLKALSASNDIIMALTSFIPSSAVAFSIISADDNEVFFPRWYDNVISKSPAGDLAAENRTGFPAVKELAVVQPYEPGHFNSSLIYLVQFNEKVDLHEVSGSARGIQVVDTDTLYGQIIYHNPEGNILPPVTGGIFPGGVNYLVIKDSVLIGSGSYQVLKNYLLQINLGHVIAEEETFMRKFNFLQPNSNAFYYADFPALLAMSGSYSGGQEDDGKQRTDITFGKITLQFLAHREGLHFSNGLVNASTAGHNAFPSLKWEVSLDTLLHTPPFEVVNHNDNSVEIIVQDKLNNLYLVDRFGKILWKKEISGPIISEIIQVDRYRNGRLQYLFNTRNYLHLVDRNGDYVSGYPLRLPSGATAGISVFDYDSKKDYRVVFPAENKRIYNLTIGGRQVRGWANPATTAQVNQPVQLLRMDGRDYIIALDSTGMPHFFDRRGAERLTIQKGVAPGITNGMYALKRAGGYVFAGKGEGGKLVEIDTRGIVSYMTLDSTFINPSGFYVSDKALNQQLTFLLADERRIAGFDDPGEKLFEIIPGEELHPELICMYIGGKLHFAAITQRDGRLLIFDENAALVPIPAISAQMGFAMARMMSDHGQYMIAGNGDKIRTYYLGLC